VHALLLEAAQLDAAKSGDAVKQLARKYGVDEEVLRKVLRYNSLVKRSDSAAGLALEQMGFRSEEGH
jgi:transposase-like protein